MKYSGFQLSAIQQQPHPLPLSATSERGGFSRGEVLTVFHRSENRYIYWIRII